MGIEILVGVVGGLIVAAIVGGFGYLGKLLSKYQQAMADQERDSRRQQIHEEIQPLEKELGELRTQLLEEIDTERKHIEIIHGSYKFRLIYLCKTYCRQGYITTAQLKNLMEFFEVYTNLGGNGQAKDWYERAKMLPIQEEEDDLTI